MGGRGVTFGTGGFGFGFGGIICGFGWGICGGGGGRGGIVPVPVPGSGSCPFGSRPSGDKVVPTQTHPGCGCANDV